MSNPVISEEEAFAYLHELRDSGVTNMWGAALYIEKDLGVSKKEAEEFLLAWIRSFA